MWSAHSEPSYLNVSNTVSTAKLFAISHSTISLLFSLSNLLYFCNCADCTKKAKLPSFFPIPLCESLIGLPIILS
uniref:Ovule protein n=1 Tax=Parascaris equorum TaxID=6256 RepID=A0A914RYM4_PAREQ